MSYERTARQITDASSQMTVALKSSGSSASTVTVSSAIGSSFEASDHQETDVLEVLAGIVPNLVALLVFPACFFALSYARFMRMDVR